MENKIYVVMVPEETPVNSPGAYGVKIIGAYGDRKIAENVLSHYQYGEIVECYCDV